MTLTLAYWIAITFVGLAAACGSLLRWQQLESRNSPNAGVRAAYRLEALWYWLLVLGLATNAAVGVAASLSFAIPEFKVAANLVTTAGLLVGDTLLAAFAVVMYWIRFR